MSVFARGTSTARRRRAGAAVSALLLAAAAGCLAAAAAPAANAAGVAPRTGHAGYTWRVVEQRANGEVHVSYDNLSNGYTGDTPASASLPVLCLLVTGSPAPADITPGFYAGWGEGWVGLTPAVSGYSLTSRAAADALCAANFGPGWREAEHHDGHYGPGLAYTGGWSLWANGAIPSGTRFWVAINDQQANPWN